MLLMSSLSETPSQKVLHSDGFPKDQSSGNPVSYQRLETLF